MPLVEDLLAGDKRAAAKLISLIEDGDPQAGEAISKLYSSTGKAHVVGVSGPPGTGKSTLIFRLAQEYRRRNKRVSVIAVDPTSPITGGALLGDRVRMGELTLDEGVFIRSMGTRGRLGGVSAATSDAIDVMDAFGSDIIFVETAGAGQTDVEVSDLVHTTLVVVMPQVGDEVQALKAGIFEVADIFVVNKADLADSDRVVTDLKMMIELGEEREWTPPVHTTVATKGDGVKELADLIDDHLAQLKASPGFEEVNRLRAQRRLWVALEEALLLKGKSLASTRAYARCLKAVLSKKLSPRQAAAELLRDVAP